MAISTSPTEGNSTVRVLRGYIASNTNDYALPSTETRLNIRDLQERQDAGEKIDVASTFSLYANQIIWASNDVYYPLSVGFSRYIARMGLDENFRQQAVRQPEFGIPAIAECDVTPQDLFVFTEGSDKRIYSYSESGNNPEGHYLVQQIKDNPQVRLISPNELNKLHGYLNERNSETNFRVAGGILVVAGYEIQDIFALNRAISFDESGQPRTLIESLNVASEIALQHTRDVGQELSYEQVIDRAARQMATLFYLDYALNIPTFEGNFSVLPQDLQEGKHPYAPYQPPDLNLERLRAEGRRIAALGVQITKSEQKSELYPPRPKPEG